MKKIINILGWVGTCLIHGATLPPTIEYLIRGGADLPPLTTPATLSAGLFFFLIRAIDQRDILYITSNSIGLTFQSILLIILLTN